LSELYLDKKRDKVKYFFLEKLYGLDENQIFYYFNNSCKEKVKQKVYKANYLDCINAIERHKKYSEANNLAYGIWPETLL